MQFEITNAIKAGRGQRLGNYLIDLIIQYALGYGVGLGAAYLTYAGIYGPYEYISTMNKFEEFLLGYVIAFIYYFTFEALTGGRTLGKYITGTKVLTWYGERPSVGRFAKRTLCRFIPFNPFSFIPEGATGWHDSISDTVVVDIKKYKQELEYRTAFNEIGSIGEEQEEEPKKSWEL